MAFTDDGFRAKISSLNESQDSIAGVGAWILFHRRFADRIAQLWMQRVKESTPSKKLTLIYLANEIVQQSRNRKKEEFLKAFDPIIAEATTAAYKGTSSDAQNKMRRVIDVWRQRSVFRQNIQEDIEKGINEIDRARSGRKPALGGSLFASSAVPPELAPVAPTATALQKADSLAKPAITTATQEYEKLTSPAYAIPSPPMHAAGLAALVKKIATAEGATAGVIKARKELIAGLEAILHANKTKLATEEAQLSAFAARKDAIEKRKGEVENAILKGLSPEETNKISAIPLPISDHAVGSSWNAQDGPERPDIEELTPPPMESFTPVGSPQ
ncbi:DUF618-domain-containing protein, partial [Amniculicola lignicola CBS 123094]